MSSSYSSSLRIELIGSGDQAGTWGTTTDNNLAYLLDSAIAGYQTVSVTSASQALTYLNGATSSASLNQSIYALLRFTTTVGATFAVYAPPVSKMYIIYNNSGYSMTLYNSTVIGNTTAAGTGLTIPDGAKYLAFSDGTNFYKTDSGTGTVTSVAMTVPSILSVTGSPVTSSGTLALSYSGTALPIANGGTNSTATATNGGVGYGTGTAHAYTAAGTAGQFLMSNGAAAPTWANLVPSGTLMLFQQTSAPTGWTKQTTHNDKALRVVSGAAGSGGTTAFSTVFTNQTPTISTSLSAAATTLSTAQMPSHSHSYTWFAGGNTCSGYNPATSASPTCISTGSTGGGGSHTHSISGSASSTAVTLNVQYVDLIIASKD